MFRSLKSFVIKKLGGFEDIDTYLENVSKEDKYYILTLAVKRLFNTIGPDDILKVHESGQWMFNGKPLSEGEKNLLIAEAVQLQNTKLWGVLQSDVKYQANRKMFLLAQDEMQLTAGKLWIFTLDAFNTRLKSLAKGQGTFNNK